MTPLLTLLLCLLMVATSFLSGIFGMAGGLILIGVLLVLLPGGSGGDYVFVNDLRGWGLVAGGLVVAVALLVAGASRRGNAG